MQALMRVHPVILCGGAGTRLWPVSRRAQPKQFVNLMGQQTLFQAALGRVGGGTYAPPIIVAADEIRFTVLEQLAALRAQPAALLIEPDGKNTAPAVLAAALTLANTQPTDLMLVMPSDHLIPAQDAFTAAVERAIPSAEAGHIVTFGVVPNHGATGYGYLELPESSVENCVTPTPLRRFIEKPNAQDADDMVASGRFLWNAGIFLFSVNTILSAYEQHAPRLFEQVKKAVTNAHQDLAFTRLAAGPWHEIESISVDYAIMEKAQNLVVQPLQTAWSDLGDWKSIWAESPQDSNGNAISPDTTALDCRNSLLRSEGEGMHLVGIGLSEMIVVAMRDAVIVAPMADSQRLGEIVPLLTAKGVSQAQKAQRDQRPWGWFETLAQGHRFQVKRIRVKPGEAISLQSHNHRAEHWIIVAGTAQVTIGDEVKLLSENQSIYVPLGAIHRLENPGLIPAEIIEVQTGSYLGEDDIVRYIDNYARS